MSTFVNVCKYNLCMKKFIEDKMGWLHKIGAISIIIVLIIGTVFLLKFGITECFIYMHGDSWKDWLGFYGSIIGALIPGMIAVWVYWNGKQREEEKERKLHEPDLYINFITNDTINCPKDMSIESMIGEGLDFYLTNLGNDTIKDLRLVFPNKEEWVSTIERYLKEDSFEKNKLINNYQMLTNHIPNGINYIMPNGNEKMKLPKLYFILLVNLHNIDNGIKMVNTTLRLEFKDFYGEIQKRDFPLSLHYQETFDSEQLFVTLRI